MNYYVPGSEEKDPAKVIMSLQQAHTKTATNTTDIATNTANIATNTTNIATNTANIATNTTNIAANTSAISTLQATVGYGYFYVNRNGSNQTGATAGAYNKIQFTNEVVDSQNFFDIATNYRFLPTQAGWYHFHVAARSTTSASDMPLAAIYKNGSIVANGSAMVPSAAGLACYSQVSSIIQLNGSTDYVEGYAFLPTGVTVIIGNSTDTHMFGYRIA